MKRIKLVTIKEAYGINTKVRFDKSLEDNLIQIHEKSLENSLSYFNNTLAEFSKERRFMALEFARKFNDMQQHDKENIIALYLRTLKYGFRGLISHFYESLEICELETLISIVASQNIFSLIEVILNNKRTNILDIFSNKNYIIQIDETSPDQNIRYQTLFIFSEILREVLELKQISSETKDKISFLFKELVIIKSSHGVTKSNTLNKEFDTELYNIIKVYYSDKKPESLEMISNDDLLQLFKAHISFVKQKIKNFPQYSKVALYRNIKDENLEKRGKYDYDGKDYKLFKSKVEKILELLILNKENSNMIDDLKITRRNLQNKFEEILNEEYPNIIDDADIIYISN